MRRMIGSLAVGLMMAAGVGMARAQDAASMMAMQANDMAMQAAQTANQMAMQASQEAMQNAQQMAMDSSFSMPMPRPALPMTARPTISPTGRSFKGGVKVVLHDDDPKAIVFYTTDGSVPTPRSPRYAGPIAVSSRLKVRAMAFDLEEMPSAVVSKTFRVNS